jgi:L-ascorbate metabolism protein UlaG (beta-lactamase superfamily)
MKVAHNDLEIQRLEHDTVIITSNSLKITIAIDPFQSSGMLRTDLKADIIFFTHDHFDHFSPKDVQPLATPAQVRASPSILDKIQTF